MALVIIVETGAKVTDSNSYISLADADEFFLSHMNNTEWLRPQLVDSQKSIALATAAKVLDQQFVWNGDRVSPDSQSMLWPRTGVSESDREVDDDEIPQNLIDAQCIIAQDLITNPDFLRSSLAAGGDGTVAGVKLGQGALEIAFKGSTEPDDAEKTIVSTEVIEMLRVYGRFVHESSAMRRVHRT